MRRPWLIRLQAICLTATLLAGGPGLATLDALFYHWHGADAMARHVRAAESSASHAERCILGAVLPGSRAVAAVPAALRITPARIERTRVVSPKASRPTEPVHLQHSRAPPARLA